MWCLLDDTSDHLPIFIKLKKYNYICINNDTALTRCMRNFTAERFIEDLSCRLDAMKNTILAPSNLNDNFSSFIFLFLDLLNKHAPLKQLSRREKKLTLKPWITKGIY